VEASVAQEVERAASAAGGAERPSEQTLTFFFVDMEGSTDLIQRLPDHYADLLAQYRSILTDAVRSRGGTVDSVEGDGLLAVFASPSGAVSAAVDAQRALAAAEWPPGAAVRARMGVDTAEVAATDTGYVGRGLHEAARIGDAGHGGQVLVSARTEALVERLPDGVRLRDHGAKRLKDLHAPVRLFELLIEGLPSDHRPLRTLDVPSNLPAQLTGFVGRRHELDEIRRLLERSRLLTLTGPGGTGKTRLSLQAADEVRGRFPDGVFFVPLAAIRDPGLVPATILQELGVHDPTGGDPGEAIAAYLGEKKMLIVLDNFEQILDAAPLVSELLVAAPGVHVIVTSRASLRLHGEQEYPVPPLEVPDPAHLPPLESLSQYAAVELFIQRATAARPGFLITNDNAPAVAEICARLDGLPLAIELAAARVKLLPPQAILERLGHRLDLLAGGARNLPDRQRTLRGAIGWSHDLLDDAQRRLFTRLAVFVGGWSLEAAEEVCGPDLAADVFDGLEVLVDHSLVRQAAAGGEPRFLMLETIREYAAELLKASGEAAEAQDRHARFFVAEAQRCALHLTGADRAQWLDRFQRDHDNIRAAIDWAVEVCDPDLAMRLGAATWRFWQMRGYLPEGRSRLEAILALPGCDAHPEARAQALEAVGGIAYWQGDLDGSRRAYEHALQLLRAAGDPAAVANGLYNLGFTFTVEEYVAKSTPYFEEALALFRQAGDHHGVANVLWALGFNLAIEGQVELAYEYETESLATYRDLDDEFGAGWALHILGLLDLRLEAGPSAARPRLEEALRIFAAADDVSGIVLIVDDFADLLWAEGNPAGAARMAGAASALQEQTGTGLAALSRDLERPPRDWEGAARDSDDWAAGTAMTAEEAVAYALGSPPSA
jgi:predicted ATPase/class 3 adenylate cyclase